MGRTSQTKVVRHSRKVASWLVCGSLPVLLTRLASGDTVPSPTDQGGPGWTVIVAALATVAAAVVGVVICVIKVIQARLQVRTVQEQLNGARMEVERTKTQAETAEKEHLTADTNFKTAKTQLAKAEAELASIRDANQEGLGELKDNLQQVRDRACRQDRCIRRLGDMVPKLLGALVLPEIRQFAEVLMELECADGPPRIMEVCTRLSAIVRHYRRAIPVQALLVSTEFVSPKCEDPNEKVSEQAFNALEAICALCDDDMEHVANVFSRFLDESKPEYTKRNAVIAFVGLFYAHCQDRTGLADNHVLERCAGVLGKAIDYLLRKPQWDSEVARTARTVVLNFRFIPNRAVVNALVPQLGALVAKDVGALADSFFATIQALYPGTLDDTAYGTLILSVQAWRDLAHVKSNTALMDNTIPKILTTLERKRIVATDLPLADRDRRSKGRRSLPLPVEITLAMSSKSVPGLGINASLVGFCITVEGQLVGNAFQRCSAGVYPFWIHRPEGNVNLKECTLRVMSADRNKELAVVGKINFLRAWSMGSSSATQQTGLAGTITQPNEDWSKMYHQLPLE